MTTISHAKYISNDMDRDHWWEGYISFFDHWMDKEDFMVEMYVNYIDGGVLKEFSRLSQYHCFLTMCAAICTEERIYNFKARKAMGI